jgi:competence protein CoiA
MGLYAYKDELLVYAMEAVPQLTYRCAGCGGRVRVRKGPSRIPHFYHLLRAPSCRLYSKSEDHLLAQLWLQKVLPAGEVILEKPFIDILRIADVSWEPQKIVFELQCSLLSPKEAEDRMEDYKTAGYQVVWILDDRIFNQRILRPAEQFLRLTSCYYATLRKEAPIFYDQFEILTRQTRIKRGRHLNVQIQKPYRIPSFSWEEDRFPSQIHQKTANTNLYFQGDLIHRALLSETVPALAFSMQNLVALERMSAKTVRREASLFKKIITKLVLEPFGFLMLFLLEKAAR